MNNLSEKPKSRHSRRSHKKTRTGCLTCRIRRKKCDEARPCNRCTSTGRRCDWATDAPGTTSTEHAGTGDIRKPLPIPSLFTKPSAVPITNPYSSPPNEPEEEILSRGSTTERLPQQSTNRCAKRIFDICQLTAISDTRVQPKSYPVHNGLRPWTATFIKQPSSFPNLNDRSQFSDLEVHCFSLFRYRTGPQFAAYFDSNLWRNFSIQLAFSHPVVFACATALGAVHRRFLSGISREALEYCAHADHLQRRAMKMVDNLKAKATFNGHNGTLSAWQDDADAVMCSEYLLGLFEGFQGNLTKAVAHMDGGLKRLLDRPMSLLYGETQHVSIDATPNISTNLLSRIQRKAFDLFSTSHRILERCSVNTDLPDVPIQFATLEEARDFIFTEIDYMMHIPATVWRASDERRLAQQVHVERLLRWSVAYANMIEKLDLTDQQKRICMLLKLTRSLAYLLLYLILYVHVDEHLREDLDDLSRNSTTIHRERSDGGSWLDMLGIGIREECLESLDVLHGHGLELDHVDIPDNLAYTTTALWTAISGREELMANLGRLTIMSDTILDETSPFHYVEHSVSFDSGIGQPLNAAREPESSAKTKHLVKSLMSKKAPCNDDETWDWLGVYGVAENLSAIEEHAVVEVVRSKVPKEINPRWIDITHFAESRRLLLRYCYHGDDGLGLSWRQEWWAF